MRVWATDLETFWSTHHTLSKMNPVSYVMHLETEIQSMSHAFDGGPMEFIRGEENIRAFIQSQDWSDTMVVGHNMSGFDAMILAWRFGLRPRRWACTLAMARPIYRAEVGGSLKALCDFLGLGHKGNLIATGTRGRKASEFTQAEWRDMERYNNQDTHLCRLLFNHLLPLTELREMAVIDMTIRMLVSPRLRVDMDLLVRTRDLELQRKAKAIQGLQRLLDLPFESQLERQLMSNPQFADLLRSLGVEPPTKVSPTTQKETYAFAKNDEELLALLEHEDPMVADAVATRLGVKSSMLETRIDTFLEMAKATGGRMPIALNYWGAATGRWSGGFKANQQNLPRIKPDSPKLTDALRNCLIAPPGHKIVVADLSGIELRVNHFLWEVKPSMELYGADAQADLYRAFAAEFYKVPKEAVTKSQRQFAKMMQLGLGFGMGWRKFQAQAKQEGYELDDETAQQAVYKWREYYDAIKKGWSLCGEALMSLTNGESYKIDPWGHCITGKHCILTPFGALRYPHLRLEVKAEHKWQYRGDQDTEYLVGRGRFQSKVYGGLICENIVQHLARQILVGQMLKIQERYPIAHTVHDEIILVVPEDEAEPALEFMLDSMKTSPEWWPEIILFAEGDIGDNYGSCK